MPLYTLFNDSGAAGWPQLSGSPLGLVAVGRVVVLKPCGRRVSAGRVPIVLLGCVLVAMISRVISLGALSRRY